MENNEAIRDGLPFVMYEVEINNVSTSNRE